eukprot:149119-Pelagomonas_calceolata.AAC.2
MDTRSKIILSPPSPRCACPLQLHHAFKTLPLPFTFSVCPQLNASYSRILSARLSNKVAPTQSFTKFLDRDSPVYKHPASSPQLRGVAWGQGEEPVPALGLHGSGDQHDFGGLDWDGMRSPSEPMRLRGWADNAQKQYCRLVKELSLPHLLTTVSESKHNSIVRGSKQNHKSLEPQNKLRLMQCRGTSGCGRKRLFICALKCKGIWKHQEQMDRAVSKEMKGNAVLANFI